METHIQVIKERRHDHRIIHISSVHGCALLESRDFWTICYLAASVDIVNENIALNRKEIMVEDNEIQRIQVRKPSKRIMFNTHFSRFLNTNENPVTLDADGNDVEMMRKNAEAEAKSNKRKLVARKVVKKL
ncbi:hypothetical protein L6452_27967 [Arctium lappa]|uniref:Uncharacterized protein n=1 Tax=Arctium lappa TaxID=4217 RepID=A0ACB8ZX73_ARCLA|nr:hypothetical protein L6452_27967 [Arctium lappa]